MNAFDALLAVFTFAFGAILGSFANVCIHRLPRGESVVHPPSRCPACGTRIAFYDNVPLLSWALLRGRCRTCRAPISPRYPLVETAVGLLVLASFLRWGPTLTAATAALLALASVVLAATDLEGRVLPDEITLGTLAVAVLLAGARDVVDGSAGARFLPLSSHVAEALLGAVFGAGLLLAVRAGYHAVRGVEGLGLGDVKMIGMIGALEGPAGVLVTLLFASVAGSVAGGAVAVARRLRWRSVEARARRGPDAARAVAAREGLLVGLDGRLLAAAPEWAEIPGSTAVGALVNGRAPAARPVTAFLRLARARAARGLPSAYGRLALDDGADYFRVLSVKAVPLPQGLLVLMGRADVPFGVFLAVGAVAAYPLGRAFLTRLLGEIPFEARLLP